MGIELGDIEPAHPRLLRLVGDCDSPVRVWLAGVCLEVIGAARRLARWAVGS